MRVLGITTVFPSAHWPESGIFNRDQITELARLVAVELVVPVPWMRRFNPPSGAFLTPDFPVSHPTYVYPPGWFRGTHGGWYLRSIRRTARELHRRNRFDLVYGMFAYPDGWAAGWIARELELPFVLKVHGSDIHQLRGDAARSPRLREALRSARAVVTVSDRLARDAAEVAPGIRTVVVRNGVDQELFSPGSKAEARRLLDLPADEKIVLYMGRMERVKGADLLPRIARKTTGGPLWVLVGSGSILSEVRASMPSGKVVYVAHVPHAETVRWYRAADVIVLPSRNEGIPNSLLEALACDRSVVASNVGGVSEVIRGGAASRLVPAEDVDSFSKSIDEILKSLPAEGEAHSIVRSFTWPESAKRLLSVFEEALR